MSASVEQEIEQVGEAIARVENEIEEINEKLKNPTISDVDKAYYRQKESQLWQKEDRLRQKESQLRQEKADIRQEKLLLIERTPVPNAAFDVASIAQELTSIAQALNQELAALRDKDDTVAFSNVTSTVFNEVMTSLDIEQVAAPWQNRPPCPQCDMTFQWGAAKEDNTENREGYMAYLKELGFPDSVRLFDASNAKELLETDLPPTKPRMKGSIDVVVLAAHNPNISGAKHNILMGIELKKDKNQQHDKIRRQVVLQHCAASRLNHSHGVLTLMTDLNDRWHFYWFKENFQQKSRYLMKFEATRSEAVYLINHFLDDPNENDSVPKSFLTRASWDSAFDFTGNSPDNASSTRQSESKNTKRGSRGQSSNGRSNNGATRQMQLAFAPSNLDFMDEDERRDEIFRMMLQNPNNRYLFPKMEVGDHSGDGPPKEIILG